MPIVTVQGLHHDISRLPLYELKIRIANAIAMVSELAITAHQVSVYFPSDLELDLRKEVIASVDGLFDRPERTSAVCAVLAMAIGRVLRDSLAEGYLVEVFVHTFDPLQGFWSSAG